MKSHETWAAYAATGLTLIAAALWAAGIKYTQCLLGKYGIILTDIQHDLNVTLYSVFYVIFTAVGSIKLFIIVAALTLLFLLPEIIAVAVNLFSKKDLRNHCLYKNLNKALGIYYMVLIVLVAWATSWVNAASVAEAEFENTRRIYNEHKDALFTIVFEAAPDKLETRSGWVVLYGNPYIVFYDNTAQRSLVLLADRVFGVQVGSGIKQAAPVEQISDAKNGKALDAARRDP